MLRLLQSPSFLVRIFSRSWQQQLEQVGKDERSLTSLSLLSLSLDRYIFEYCFCFYSYTIQNKETKQNKTRHRNISRLEDDGKHTGFSYFLFKHFFRGLGVDVDFSGENVFVGFLFVHFLAYI